MLRARDNPFATDRVLRERYRLDASGWALLFARLRALRHCGAIVGPHGSGKTTLLEDLAVRLEANGWRIKQVQLTVEFPALGHSISSRELAALEPRDLLLLDGAEQLSWLQWRWLRLRSRGAGGVIITTHEAGRLPTLWRCSTTPGLLRDLSGSLGVPLAEPEAIALYTRHAGNLRNALRELYDRHAEHVG
jgi:hypothetical protein